MDDRSDWRANLARLLRALNLKARIALGAAASVAAIGGVPSVAQAKPNDLGAVSAPAPKGEGKIGSMFVLKKADGSGKAFAEHGSHSSHSSHRSHRSGAWVR